MATVIIHTSSPSTQRVSGGRWFKEENEQLTPIKFSERIFIVSGGLLKISKAKIEDSGKYLCWVNNTAGEETIQVLLTITGNIRQVVVPFVTLINVPRTHFSATHRSLATSSTNCGRREGRHIPVHGLRPSHKRHQMATQWKGDCQE